MNPKSLNFQHLTGLGICGDHVNSSIVNEGYFHHLMDELVIKHYKSPSPFSDGPGICGVYVSCQVVYCEDETAVNSFYSF